MPGDLMRPEDSALAGRLLTRTIVFAAVPLLPGIAVGAWLFCLVAAGLATWLLGRAGKRIRAVALDDTRIINGTVAGKSHVGGPGRGAENEVADSIIAIAVFVGGLIGWLL